MTSTPPTILDECPLSSDACRRSVRARVYRLLFVQSEHDAIACAIERFIVVMIVVATGVLVVGSLPDLSPQTRRVLWGIEIATATCFGLEYIVRLWSVTASSLYRRPIVGRLRYSITFFAIVDLLSVAPLLAIGFGQGLEFLAIARLARLLKLGRYSVAVRALVTVLSDRAPELRAAVGILVVALLFAATGIFVAEHRAQPEAFQSIPHSLWWAVVTITTLGYGDVTPITTLGRVFASITVLVGLLIVTIPTGIVSAGFYDELRQRRQATMRCPRCGESDLIET